jgi:hypothetical protein
MKIEKLHHWIEELDELDRRIEAQVTGQAENLRTLRIGVARQSLAVDLRVNGRADADRRRRDNRLWKRGNLVRIADLLDLDKDVLLGALRGAAAFEEDARWIARWRADGRRVLAKESEGGEAGTGPSLPEPGKSADPAAARKAVNHRIITAGGIVEQAGLGNWEPEVLAGVLAAIARHQTDQSRVAAWKAAGAVDSGKPATKHADVEVRFPEPIARALGVKLQEFGMSFDRRALVWTGFADPTLASRIAKEGDGEVRVRGKSQRKRRKTSPRKKRLRSTART